MTVLSRPLRNLALLLAVLGLAAHRPGGLEAQVRWQNDFRLSYEYDDNVREDVLDAVRAQVARISVKSDLLFDDRTNDQLSLVYQGGYKRYFDVGRESLDITNQFLHEGQVTYRRLLGESRLDVSGGVKIRDWQDDAFFFPNEDGFTRLWGSVGARRNFTPQLAGEVSLGLSGIEFDHLDEVFGYEAQAGRVTLSQGLGTGVTGDFSYAAEQRTYDGRGKLRGAEDDPTNIFDPDRPRQIDVAHEAGIGISFLGSFGFQGRYRYRLNDSNSFGFTYHSHIFNLQLAQQLPWRMIAQFYGAVELRKFREPIRGLVGAVDVEDTDNNVLVFRLLKELNGHVDVEARYGRYRNESINLNAFYTRNVYSLGFRVRP